MFSRKTTTKLEKWFDKAMYVGAMLAPVALAPQVYKIYATHHSADLEITTWAALACINVMWVIWGRMHKAYPVMISSSFLAVLNILAVIGIFLYP